MGARAEEERARLAYSSNIEGVNTSVARLSAELADAQWDLDQTVTRAPAAGFITQVGLRPGMYVVPAPLRPSWSSLTPTSATNSSRRHSSRIPFNG